MRGGERVLEILCGGFPQAPVYTLIHNPAAISDTINRHPVHASFLNRVPGATENYRYLLPLFPAAIGSLSPPPADLLISTSHCVAKGLRVQPGTRHLCYCFTPMRYAWTFYREYFGGSPLKSLLAHVVLPYLRHWDRASSKRVDHFVAISENIRGRIQEFYQRDSDVVYPPIDTGRWTTTEAPRGRAFDLMVSALVPYKRVDLAVRAYTQYGFPLKIVGSGTELERLRSSAGPNVELLGRLSDEAILGLYRDCRQLVFPGEEDFGLVPLEAQACGTPVVAYRRGGVLETVIENETGIFFEEQTENALIQAARHASTVTWDRTRIRRNAERFNIQNFVDGMNTSIRRCRGLA
jgi:glycosyltransferase involved in cell wall biosynthesis